MVTISPLPPGRRLAMVGFNFNDFSVGKTGPTWEFFPSASGLLTRDQFPKDLGAIIIDTEVPEPTAESLRELAIKNGVATEAVYIGLSLSQVRDRFKTLTTNKSAAAPPPVSNPAPVTLVIENVENSQVAQLKAFAEIFQDPHRTEMLRLAAKLEDHATRVAIARSDVEAAQELLREVETEGQSLTEQVTQLLQLHPTFLAALAAIEEKGVSKQ